MESRENKKNDAVIDEALLMSIMAGENKADQQQQEPTVSGQEVQSASKEKVKTKRAGHVDYERLFFKNAGTTARSGKSVYIRPEFHERLSRIVQVIGEDKLTIYAYLDNLLEHHFLEFGEQITLSFNNKYKPIL